MKSALILFSGGQDSATCLAWALDRFDHVETIGFDYGQNHHVEMTCRKALLGHIPALKSEWRGRIGQDHELDLGVLGRISDTALTRQSEIELAASGLPNTFVPGRNLLFLTLAGALGYRRGITDLVAGMCETDYSGYPDCRQATLNAQMAAMSLGMDRSFNLHTPLMHLDKAETWDLALQIGGSALVEVIVEHSHTCYRGDRRHRHEWGYGCGDCPACDLRAKGFVRFGERKAA
jgi:7-cyano-7-deazaguanine synthase